MKTFCLTLFSLVGTLSFHPQSIAAPIDTSLQSYLLDSLNWAISSPEWEEGFDGSLTQEQKDSAESRSSRWKTGYYRTEMTYASDSSFAVYTYFGEGCGAYCTGFVTSFLVWNQNGKTAYREVEMHSFPEIFEWKNTIGENFYLVISHGGSRTRSCCFNVLYSAHLFKLTNSVIEAVPFNMNGHRTNPVTLQSAMESGDANYEHYMEEDLITFDPEKLRLYVAELKELEDDYHEIELVFVRDEMVVTHYEQKDSWEDVEEDDNY